MALGDRATQMWEEAEAKDREEMDKFWAELSKKRAATSQDTTGTTTPMTENQQESKNLP